MYEIDYSEIDSKKTFVESVVCLKVTQFQRMGVSFLLSWLWSVLIF